MKRLTKEQVMLLHKELVNDMFTERENDDFKYDSLATQYDFDAF